MSIGFLKRFLGFAKLAAVLVILGAAWGYFGHRQTMAEPWSPPDFRPTVRASRARVARIDALQMALGRYQRAVEPTADEPEAEDVEEIGIVLKKMGTIKHAFVVYPPYESIVPTIIFEYNQPPSGQEKLRTLRVNEALVDRPRADSPFFRVPVRYQFIGCEPDPEHAGWTYFLFDMKCDGTDIQKLRWKLETEETTRLKTASGGESGGQTVRDPKMYFGPEGGAKPEKEPGQEPGPAPAQPETVAVAPAPEPIRATVAPGSLFEDEDGVTAPTREGVEYLKNNYQKILKETRTQTYRDRSGKAAGIRVVGIKRGSVAGEFGILKDDVILSINGVKVTKQAEAVNIVKAELRKKVRVIRVKILRRGREVEKRFDTRDPQTRRMAKRAFR